MTEYVRPRCRSWLAAVTRARESRVGGTAIFDGHSMGVTCGANLQSLELPKRAFMFVV